MAHCDMDRQLFDLSGPSKAHAIVKYRWRCAASVLLFSALIVLGLRGLLVTIYLYVFRGAGLSEYFLLLLLLRRDKSPGLFNRTHTLIILFAIQSIQSFLRFHIYTYTYQKGSFSVWVVLNFAVCRKRGASGKYNALIDLPITWPTGD